ncbi:uncharacterized protein LOC129958884 [Argiope bruennichi]|uniref:Uncharacterized protein n=1 Tax=Argiope bruennichi TaxID=94029 RepID=A0A8T0F7H1_ARGBR|nr:uncharacterized protein LOC129958884 [Argiope bruennichi]XP_055927582.1 uncharacterized protein LOC129958884 [Argiope bruennichi]KAF8784943.1 hypothetical protein HNY73_010550 [Argiope bruennichi]
MGFMYQILLCFAVILYSTEASLTVPGELMSPLGVPASMGPAGLNAIKLAVGGRLLNLLGAVRLGSVGSLPAGLLGPQFKGSGLAGLGQLMPRSADFSKRRGPNIPQTFDIRKASPTEIENFFAVLDKVDSNKCISRLVCEVGANPKVLEDLGHNIKDAMSSLRILEKNALSSKYKQVLLQGQKGSIEKCARNFKACDRRSYRLVKAFVKAFRGRS